MNRRYRTLLVAVLALAALGLGARSYLIPKPDQTAKPVAAVTAPAMLEFQPTEIVTAAPVELQQQLRLSGSLRAVEVATVKARVGGDVRAVLAREGEAVYAGQVLVRMDTTEYEARVAQARANLNNARAQLDIAAKSRDNNLALVEKGFISRNAFDNASSQYAAAVANVDAAQAALDLVLKSLADTVIRAPIAGLVSARHVQPGEKVASDNKLLEIVNLQRMELEAAVPAADIAHVATGQPVELHVDGLAERFTGTVARINPATQAGTRSVPVYIQVANPRNQLRAGMFAEVRLTLARRTGVLALPPSALRRDGESSYVFVIADGRIARRPVTLGMTGTSGDEHRVEVSNGLNVGEQVVRTDMGRLLPGTPARIAQPPRARNEQAEQD